MKTNRILLTLVAFSLAIVGAFASAFLLTPVGDDPYNGATVDCTAASLSPNQTGCGSGDDIQCTVRFEDPENSELFTDVPAFDVSCVANQAIKREINP